jgi:DNA uptake protein ComE-like DNA-binding protein
MKRLSFISLLAIPVLLVAFAAPSFAGAKHASTAKPAKAPASTAAKPVELVDINTATKEQLVALPAIGDAYAQKIIDNRPYTRKAELRTRNILPETVYAKVTKRIIAKQAKSAVKK